MKRVLRKPYNEELHNLYSSPTIIGMIKSRRIRLTGHEERIWEKSNACMILVEKSEGKKLVR
jgi:hypothetical protein